MAPVPPGCGVGAGVRVTQGPTEGARGGRGHQAPPPGSGASTLIFLTVLLGSLLLKNMESFSKRMKKLAIEDEGDEEDGRYSGDGGGGEDVEECLSLLAPLATRLVALLLP